MTEFLGKDYTRKQLIREVARVTGIKVNDVTVILDFADLLQKEKFSEGRTITIGKIGKIGFVLRKGRRKYLSLEFKPQKKYRKFKKLMQNQYRMERREAERGGHKR